MGKPQSYKEALMMALDDLEESEGHAMSAVLNIAFSGPYERLGRLHEEGEIVQMEPAMFEGTGDANIDLVLKLVAQIQQTRESIRNLNALNGEE